LQQQYFPTSFTSEEAGNKARATSTATDELEVQI
jgi:hypothetical protein